jgi:pre-rRNA-processing protein TSR3
MKSRINLIVYHTNEDDPKKCSARKLNKFGFARLETNIRKIPKGSIVLSPFAKKSISKEDIDIARKNGIIAVDCSWKNAESCFNLLDIKNISRSIPFVVAVNPINYGKPFKLSTLEAFATVLYIFNEIEHAKEILKLYKWAPHFLEMNKEPLEEYRKAENSGEIIKIMKQYI